jgi:hypothetical protein
VCSFRDSTLYSCGPNTTFSYHPFSKCVEKTHYEKAIQTVPEQFAADDCTINEYFWLKNNKNQEGRIGAGEVGAPFSGRVCPHSHDGVIYYSGSST